MPVPFFPDRSLLHFDEEVKKHFAFLEGLGFRCVGSDVTLVRYESPAMTINVYQGRHSYEFGLEIEAVKVPKESYSLSEILRLVDAERADNYRSFAGHTVESVAEGVRQLAGFFHECIDAGILSDKQLFSRLKQQRGDWARKYEIEVKLKQAHSGVKSAWIKKDFTKVVDILSPLQEHLNPSDLKKLDYAKKHL